MTDRLRLGHQRVDVEALERRRPHADAVLEPLVAEVGAPRPGGDREAGRVAERRKAHLAVADVDERADVTLREPVRAHRVDASLGDVGRRERRLDPEDVRRLPKSIDVLVQSENRRAAVRTAVAANAFEDTDAVVQGVGENVDLRVVPRDEPPVHPDLFSLLHSRVVHALPANVKSRGRSARRVHAPLRACARSG